MVAPVVDESVPGPSSDQLIGPALPFSVAVNELGASPALTVIASGLTRRLIGLKRMLKVAVAVRPAALAVTVSVSSAATSNGGVKKPLLPALLNLPCPAKVQVIGAVDPVRVAVRVVVISVPAMMVLLAGVTVNVAVPAGLTVITRVSTRKPPAFTNR